MSLPDTTTTIEHPSVLGDIEFVTALHAALNGDAPDWPIPANVAQALAVADVYGVDGSCGTPLDELDDIDELRAALVAMCILAHACRQAQRPPLQLTREQFAALTEVANAIATDDCDPVWACADPELGGVGDYILPSGQRFVLRPIVTLDTLEAFHMAHSAIEDAIHR